MKKIFFLSIISIFFISCGGSRPSSFVHTRGASPVHVQEAAIAKKPTARQKAQHQQHRAPRKTQEEFDIPELEYFDESFLVKSEIIDFAKSFQGTKYKFGGTSTSGMDCSGLVCTAFETKDIQLPRISRDMATKGSPISLTQVEPGDLIFFKTDNRRVINHVGLVVESEEGDIKFIHSTVRRGVIISSLDENYWKNAFVEARRVI